MTDGVILVDKEEGMTSFDAVARIRRLFGTRQVGHTGTLDPMATGLLAVMVGRAVKASEYLTCDGKSYVATTDYVTGNFCFKDVPEGLYSLRVTIKRQVPTKENDKGASGLIDIYSVDEKNMRVVK